MSDSIRWGILGPGKIAHSFSNDLKLVSDGELRAVASRNKERAEAFAAEYNIPLSFGSYEELFECDQVDVIYIATPHTGHEEWAIKAMEMGKHVLCEKPMGVNARQVERMISIARKNNVFLMEALWSRFNPTLRKVKQLVDDGAIGALNYLHADFAFNGMDRDDTSRLFNPELAGGSLLDIGIYPIFLAYLLLGSPETIHAHSKFHRTGAEIQTSMLFDYPGAQAILYSGFTSKSNMQAMLCGTSGTITIWPRWHEAHGYTLEIEGVQEKIEVPKNGKGYTYEIEEVQKCLRSGKIQSDLWSHQNSTDLIQLLDMVRATAGISFPIES